MPTDWKTLYEAALRERDPAKLAEACQRARRAIHDRVLELGTQRGYEIVIAELEEALRQLVAHESKRKPM